MGASPKNSKSRDDLLRADVNDTYTHTYPPP